MPISEAAVGRAFSRHRLVHTENRSKLSPETFENFSYGTIPSPPMMLIFRSLTRLTRNQANLTSLTR